MRGFSHTGQGKSNVLKVWKEGAPPFYISGKKGGMPHPQCYF